MSALVLDAGALVAVDRGDRAMVARLRVAQQHGVELRSNAMVVAQVWRHRHGRQAGLAQLLHAVDVRAVSPQDGRQAGVLLGVTGTSDPVDATVVLLASPGDRILTSDPSLRYSRRPKHSDLLVANESEKCPLSAMPVS